MGLFNKNTGAEGMTSVSDDEFTEEELTALNTFVNIVCDGGYRARIAYILSKRPDAHAAKIVIEAIDHAVEDIETAFDEGTTGIADVAYAAMSLRVMAQVFDEIDDFSPKEYALYPTLLTKCERIYYKNKEEDV
jgi:hypothetical protein